jgi:chitin synthase
MWDQVGLLARAANENGVPAITDPWPTKDVSAPSRKCRDG